jgi:hypothetical protein
MRFVPWLYATPVGAQPSRAQDRGQGAGLSAWSRGPAACRRTCPSGRRSDRLALDLGWRGRPDPAGCGRARSAQAHRYPPMRAVRPTARPPARRHQALTNGAGAGPARAGQAPPPQPPGAAGLSPARTFIDLRRADHGRWATAHDAQQLPAHRLTDRRSKPRRPGRRASGADDSASAISTTAAPRADGGSRPPAVTRCGGPGRRVAASVRARTRVEMRVTSTTPGSAPPARRRSNAHDHHAAATSMGPECRRRVEPSTSIICSNRALKPEQQPRARRGGEGVARPRARRRPVTRAQAAPAWCAARRRGATSWRRARPSIHDAGGGRRPAKCGGR